MKEEIELSTESGFMAGEFSPFTSEPLLIPINSNGATCDIFRKIDSGKTTVIKRLRDEHLSNPVYHGLFRKEYETGCVLDSPNIVRYLNFSDEADDCHIEMEYVDGDTLKERLLSTPEYFSDRKNLNKFLIQLLDGLHYMHSRQIVHLDLKPDNIMLSKVNNDVKILDLGFCYTDAYQTSIGCNPAFAAPEQLDGSGDVDARTDIYAVGKLLEYILSKAKVSHASKYRKIIARCLSNDKEKRYQDAINISKEIGQIPPPKIVRAVLLLLTVTVVVAVFFHFVNVHRLIYGYDFSDYTLCYNILSDEDKTCELVKYDPSLVDRGASNVVIKDVVEHNGREYKVQSVASRAFMQDTIINKLSILSSKVHFGSEAFRYCSNLYSIYVNDDFNQFSQGLFGCCLKLETFRFPSAMTEVPQACFHKTGLKNIFLPDGVKVIRQDAFCDCDSLTELVLPPNLETLERGAFYQCDNLEEVTIPASVKNIGQYCFMDCPKLKTVYNHALVPQRVSEIFDETARVTIFVPQQSLDLYKQSPCWKDQIILPLTAPSAP